jgi:hypothetical protein
MNLYEAWPQQQQQQQQQEPCTICELDILQNSLILTACMQHWSNNVLVPQHLKGLLSARIKQHSLCCMAQRIRKVSHTAPPPLFFAFLQHLKAQLQQTHDAFMACMTCHPC